jgi:hypothetical protein
MKDTMAITKLRVKWYELPKTILIVNGLREIVAVWRIQPTEILHFLEAFIQVLSMALV